MGQQNETTVFGGASGVFSILPALNNLSMNLLRILVRL